MIVVDTSILARGLRSRSGPSGHIVTMMVLGQIEFAITAPLMFEYETVLKRPKNMRDTGLALSEVDDLLDAIVKAGHQTTRTFSYRPQLRDPNDEIVLECAINASATLIVTGDKDFGREALRPFSIVSISPGAYVARIEETRR